MRTKYEIRRDLVKNINNLSEINRLIMKSEPSKKIYNDKKIIKSKINKLKKEYEERITCNE